MDAQPHVVAGDVDLPSLRLLATLAETGSISAAGARLGISQQAASVRMRRLEDRLGLTLLVRGPHGSRLTPAGTVAAQWAAEVAGAADRFVAGVTALHGPTAPPLRVAASLTVAEYLLPRWLMMARGQHPDPGSRPAIAVTAANSEHVVELVADGSHQLGFIESPLDVGSLEAATVARDELVVVVAPGHPWARRRALSPAELARTPLITRERGSGTRLSAERMLAEAGHPPVPPLQELPTTAAVRTAVAAGAAPALLSILAVRDELTAGRLMRVPVRGLRFVRDLRVVHRPGAVDHGEAARLLDVVARLG